MKRLFTGVLVTGLLAGWAGCFLFILSSCALFPEGQGLSMADDFPIGMEQTCSLTREQAGAYLYARGYHLQQIYGWTVKLHPCTRKENGLWSWNAGEWIGAQTHGRTTEIGCEPGGSPASVDLGVLNHEARHWWLIQNGKDDPYHQNGDLWR